MPDAPRVHDDSNTPTVSEAVVQQIYEMPLAPQFDDKPLPSNPTNDAAAIHLFSGNGLGQADESALRRTLLGLTSEQIGTADAAYQKEYGRSMVHDMLLSDMSNGTKASLAILMQGKDQISPEERQTLAELGMETKDISLFGDAMKTMRPEQRHALEAKFGPQLSLAFSGPDLSAAKDYMQFGRLTAAENIHQVYGNFPNQKERIDWNVKSMGLDEKQRYVAGQKLTDMPPGRALTQSEQTSKDYYNRLHTLLKDHGTSEQVSGWEQSIRNSVRRSAVLSSAPLMKPEYGD